MSKNLTSAPFCYPDEPLRLFPHSPAWSVVSVECDASHFSASTVARAVEDCDAHLLNFNVTDGNLLHGPVRAEIRTDHRNAESVARSLERYGYTVTAIAASEGGDDTDAEATGRSRIEELIRYLEI